MTILITGASGEIGRLTTRKLLETIPASELILVTRRPEALAEVKAQGAEVRNGDFDAPDSLPAAFEGADRMLLISTLSVGRRVEQHRRAIEAAREAGVGLIVYTSSGGAVPENPAVVIRDHLGTEAVLKASGVDYTILRDSLYAETPALKMAPRFIPTGKWIASCAEGRVAFVAKADCVEIAAKVLLDADGHRNRTYELTGPALMSMREAAALAAEISGRPIEYIVVSDAEMDAMLAAAGVPEEYVEGMFTPGVGASSRRDILTYEQGIRGGHFAVLSNDVEAILGRPPTSVREVFLQHRDALVGAQ